MTDHAWSSDGSESFFFESGGEGQSFSYEDVADSGVTVDLSSGTGSITGGSAIDYFNGAVNSVTGTSHNDTFIGATGGITFTGGSGTDTYIFNSSGIGQNTIIDNSGTLIIGGSLVSGTAAQDTDGHYDLLLDNTDGSKTSLVGEWTSGVDFLLHVGGDGTSGSNDSILLDYQSGDFGITLENAGLAANSHTATQLSVGTNQQEIVALADGRYIVAGSGFVGATYKALAQIFNADGSASTSQLTLATGASGQVISNTHVLAREGGGFTASWVITSSGTSTTKMEDFNSDGSAITSSLATFSNIAVGDITRMANADTALAWQAVSGSNNVIKFDFLGDSQGAFTVSGSATTSLLATPNLTQLADGGYLITWAQNRSSSQYDIKGQVFNADGSTRSSVFTATTTGTPVLSNIHAAALADGGFVVAGRGASNTNTGFFQVYKADGSTLGSLQTVQGGLLDAIALQDGGFMVSQAGNTVGGTTLAGAYLQTFNADGSSRGDTTRVDSTTTTADDGRLIALTTGGTVAGLWQTVTGSGTINSFEQVAGSYTPYAAAPVFGSGGSDSLAGTSRADFLDGGSGNDTLSGGAGNDYISGNSGTGDDVLRGDAGDDTIVADHGNDTVTGGAGADRFVFLKEPGLHSVITDFSVAQGDKIDLSDAGSRRLHFADIGISQNGADTVLSLGGGQTVTLSGITSSTITDASFIGLTPPNTAPALASAISDTSTNEDAAFSLDVHTHFSDADAGDTLTFTATKADGSALPSWLAFNTTTGVFSGTPANGDVGTVSVKVTAADGSNASVFDIFDITVNNTNDAPTVANAIGSQSTNEDAAFSFTVPSTTFADVDAGDSLTLSATLSNGSALPAWLSFNSSTGVLSGTPANGDVGTIAVKVTATDTASASVSSTFNLTVNNTNDAPTVANTIQDQTTDEDAAFSFTVAANSFADVDTGDTLTYTATKADGSALPSWLAFNTTTGVFSGTPANADVGTVSVKVTATDGSNASVFDIFDITVNNTNDAPTLVTAASNQTATGYTAFSYALPTGMFADVDAGDVLTYTATKPDGSSLPLWLNFNPATGVFSGTPNNAQVGNFTVLVTATDLDGATATNSFTITVQGGTITGTAGADSLTGSTGDDTMLGLAGNDTLSGDDGQDSLDGGTDNDSLLGNTGNDTVIGGTENDIAYGGHGDDILAGGSGDDYLVGNLGTDSLSGEDGNDTLKGGIGADTLSGGNGNDLITSGEGDTGDGTSSSDGLNANGNAGSDTLGGGDGLDTLHGGTENDYIYGGAGADSLYGDNGDDTVIGGDGNDSVQGNDGNDLLYGSTGTDTLDAGAGNDYADGGAGDDSVSGGDGSDTLTGSYDNDTVSGGAGNDLLYGTTGNDSILGGDGNDVLYGGVDNDTLIGGAGADSMDGGSGADVFVYQALTDSTLSALDYIQNFNQGTGGSHIDLHALNISFSGLSISHTGSGATAQTWVNVTGTGFWLDLAGNLTLTSGDFVF